MKRLICVSFLFLCFGLSTLNGLAQSGTFTIRTVAGNGISGWNGTGGLATNTPLFNPSSVAVDAAGNLFIGDHFVHKVSPGGLFNRGFATPELGAGGIAVDVAGNLFVDDQEWSVVYKVPPQGNGICCIAGNGARGFNGDGPVNIVLLNVPLGLAVDTAGNVFIADSGNHRIRKLTSDGMIRTVAGNGSAGFSGDGGPATSAQLDFPSGVAVDAAGNLYIVDASNRVRKVTTDGVIQTVAGNGSAGFSGDESPATAAQLNGPTGIAVDSVGNLYIADSSNNRVRKVTPDGVIHTVAGNGVAGFSGDGGPATSAQLNGPTGVAVDAAGNIFIADKINYRVRKVSMSSPVSSDPAAVPHDFSGDRKSDILLRNAGGNVSMWVMDGNTITADVSIANIWNGWTISGSGDFNGDGKADVLWRDIVGNTAVWLMDGAAIISYGYTANMPVNWAIAGVADFDADGKADILWRDATGNVLIWLMDGSRIANYSFIANIWTGWSIVGTGDFNGDAKADILWRDTAGNIAIWLMDGMSVSSYSSIGNLSTSWTNAGIADFDGDGKADILWRNIDGQVSMWLMNSFAINSSLNIANISLYWAIVGDGDFNGDGKADILWRGIAGDMVIWLMDGPVMSSYSGVGNLSNRTVQ